MENIITFTPSSTYEDALKRAALLSGIELSYVDVMGFEQRAKPETVRAVLEALGIGCGTLEELNATLEFRMEREWSALLESTVVVGQQPLPERLATNLPADWSGRKIRLAIDWEDGRREERDWEIDHLPTVAVAEIGGRRFLRKQLPIPQPLPLGDHSLTVEMAERRARMHLIVGPDHTWRPEDAGAPRAAGLAVSLYGLRSERNWGFGDTTDLKHLARWAAQAGFSFIGLNPLHAIHNRFPYNTSPYLPVSALFRNFLYLDVTAIEEYASCEDLERWLGEDEIASLREAEDVEYERVARIKLLILKRLYRHFLRRGGPRRDQFHAWCREQGETLERFAVFCALDAWIHRRLPHVWLWTDWPDQYRFPHSPAVKAFAQRHARRVEFYQWLQWLLDRQFASAQDEARKAGMAVGAYHDLALATDRYGCDLWAHGDWYVAGCRVGSPPDAFSPEGQDWSFPPPNRDAQRDSGYRLFRETIRSSARHGGALRIDHVMRFYRLYWIPEGLSARDGLYVKDYAEDLLRILALESLRGRFVVVGEDLGTVPPELHGLLERYGILGYRVLYFERDGAAFRPASAYAPRAVVTTTTHDLPALAGFWLGSDIEARRQAGLLSSDEDYQRQWRDRDRDRKQLLELLIREDLLPDTYSPAADHLPPLDHQLQQAIISFLAATPSAFFVLNQEDLTLDPRQQNLPGSTHQHPNWRRKTAFTLEELLESSQWQIVASALRRQLHAAGRCALEFSA